MRFYNRKSAYKTIMLVFVTVFITAIFTIVGFTKYLKKDGNIKYIIRSVETGDLETEILKIRSVIDEYYLKDIDEQKLIDGAIKGYVSALGDKYTQYLVGEEWEEVQTNTTGQYVGIGVYITKDTEANQIVIVSPIDGSPAKEAGILPGDIILKIDDVEYTGEDMDLALEVMKGEVGSKIKLEIKRENEIINLEVERQKIKLNRITSTVLNENIGYISIPSFDEGTADEFKDVSKELIEKGVEKLILDLRNNTGGIVSEAVQIADYIIPKDKTLMITIDKNGNKEETKSKEDNFITGELAVLVNGNSASSTEILVAAIKDNNRGKIVGTTTYGKGVMQQIMELSGNNALKITTEEFITPNGNKINEVGIEPDETVVLTTDNEGKVIDTQLQKAVSLLK